MELKAGNDVGQQGQPVSAASLRLDPFFAGRELRSAICKNVLLQPDHFSFKIEHASRLLEEYGPSDPDFAHTYSTFIELFEALRRQLATLRLSAANRLDIVRHAIGLCVSSGLSIFGRRRSERLAALGRPITSADIQSLRELDGDDGNSYTGDEVLEAIFDTLKSILDYCEYLTLVPMHDEAQAPDFARVFTLFHWYSIYRADWEECLWLGNSIDGNDDNAKQKSVLVARAIGLSRDFSVRFQHLLRHGIAGSKAAHHRFLNGRLKPSRKIARDFTKFRDHALKQIPYPFLAMIVAREMESRSSLWLIVEVYLFLNFISISNIRRIDRASLTSDAFAFEEIEFGAFVCKQLGIDRDALDKVLPWLTYKSGQKTDIWLTPLYWIENHYVVLYPMCAYANFERFIQSIFSRFDSVDPGKEFERYVIESSRRAVIGNPRLPKIKIEGPSAMKSGGKREEIDLILRTETVWFVGEVKYDCFAADEINVFQHIDKMKRACEQAARKAEYVRRNWMEFASIQPLGAEQPVVFGFALTEMPFLSGFSYQGVPIISLRDFEDFFEGEILFNARIERGAPIGVEVVKTFRDAASMPEDLWKYMTLAPRTARFVDRLHLVKIRRPIQELADRGYTKLQFEVR